MINKLITGTGITAIGYFIVAVIGLLLAPLLIVGYGVVGFGMITLARILLPAGGVGIFDFGISEISAQIIASARETKVWRVANARLILIACLTTALGIFVGALLYIFSENITYLLKIPESEQLVFANIIQITGIATPLLFFGLIFEGLIEGQEKYLILRITEIVSTVLYALAVIFGLHMSFDFTWPVYVYLGSQLCKCFFYGIVAWHFLPETLCGKIDAGVRAYVFERGKLLLVSRFLGSIQTQAAPLLIGVFLGPFAVGVYDAISRLPRFLKIALSVVNTTLLPAAMRLEVSGDRGRLNALGAAAVSVLPAIVFPPIATLALFSGDILVFWLGQEFAVYAFWLALFLIIPAFNTVLSCLNSILMVRPQYLLINNKISCIQITTQMVISLLILEQLSQNAFIFGQVAATLVFFPWQLNLGFSQLNLAPELRTRFFIYTILLMGCVALMMALHPAPFEFSSPVVFVAVMMGVLGLLWILTFNYFLLAATQSLVRNILIRAIKIFIPRW